MTYVVLLIIIPIMVVGFVEFMLVTIETVINIFNKWKKHKELETIRRNFLDNPVEMVNNKGEIFWVGYKK